MSTAAQGGLKALWQSLNDQLGGVSPGSAVRATLERGAHVALRIVEGRRELLIWRDEPFTTEDGPAKWLKEVRVFGATFGTLAWEANEGMSKAGGPAVRLREPASHAACAGCGRSIDANAKLYGDGERCSTCLAKAGQPVTHPCRTCGKPASPNVATHIGLCPACMEASRVRQGFMPVDRPVTPSGLIGSAG